jgi:hypothetical protein
MLEWHSHMSLQTLLITKHHLRLPVVDARYAGEFFRLLRRDGSERKGCESLKTGDQPFGTREQPNDYLRS